MTRSWLPWGFIAPDRIDGRTIGVRYNDYANTDSDGQLRMEDGRIIDFQNHHKASMAAVSNGPFFTGRAWITTNGTEYDSVFDLIKTLPAKAPDTPCQPHTTQNMPPGKVTSAPEPPSGT